MPTQTVSLEKGQYQYIVATANDESFSERVRELIDKGMEVEDTEEQQ